MKGLAALIAALLCAASALPGQTPTPTPTSAPSADPRYGPYPTHYKEIVYNWMRTQLVDVDSARIEWSGDPQIADLGKDGEHLYGWLVNFKVNARNRFGAYTGKQSHGALIFNGQVIKGLGFAY
jgi:hypothetical protein